MRGIIIMKFGYARVSGLSQDLELQVKQLEDQGVPRENIYAEKLFMTGLSSS